MAATVLPMVGVLYVDGGPQGFSEKYFLPQSNYTAAIANFSKLVAWRATLLANDFSINWARVSFLPNPREAKAAISAPVLAIGTTVAGAVANKFGPTNKIEDALLFRFETAEGLYSNRQIRALPDAIIADDVSTVAFAELAAAPADVPTDPTADTWLDCLKGYVAYVRDNTVHSRKALGPLQAWDLTEFNKAIFRRASVRKTGRPFGTPAGRS